MHHDHLILEQYIKQHPVEAGRILNEFNNQVLANFVTEVQQSILTDIFVLLDRHKAAHTLEQTDINTAISIIEKLNIQKAAVILRLVNKSFQTEVLNAVSKEVASSLKLILNYPVSSAGAYLDPSVFTLPEDTTIRESIKRIKKANRFSIPYVFVVSRDEKLSGIVEIRDLIIADSKDRIDAIIQSNIPKVFAEVNIKTILKHEGWINYNALPVVNRSDIFLGAIKQTDIQNIEDVDEVQHHVHVQKTSEALGDLYKIGLTSFIRAADEHFRKSE